MPVPNNSPATAITITFPWTLVLDTSLLDVDGAWHKVTMPATMTDPRPRDDG